jgi:hypothetical protein
VLTEIATNPIHLATLPELFTSDRLEVQNPAQLLQQLGISKITELVSTLRPLPGDVQKARTGVIQEPAGVAIGFNGSSKTSRTPTRTRSSVSREGPRPRRRRHALEPHPSLCRRLRQSVQARRTVRSPAPELHDLRHALALNWWRSSSSALPPLTLYFHEQAIYKLATDVMDGLAAAAGAAHGAVST